MFIENKGYMKLIELLGRKTPSVNSTSQSLCLAPIAGCLAECEKVVKSVGSWSWSNDDQERFLVDYYMKAREEIGTLPELESISSPDADKINAFLADRGFQIRLDPFSPLEIGMASVFKLLLSWTMPGKVTTVREEQFPAVRIHKNRSFHVSQHVPCPIVSLETQSGDVVRMTVLPNPPKGFELLELIQKIDATLQNERGYDGVIFPMIDYDEMINISWIRGMETEGKGGPWRISQALQQTKFRMNEVGAKVESAVAMGARFMYCASEPIPDLVIDHPFLLWIKREGLSHPLFIGHFTEIDWKRPERL